MGVRVWKTRHPTMPTLLKVRAMTKLENDSRIVNPVNIKGSCFTEKVYPVHDIYETSIFPGIHTEGEIS